MFSSAFSFLFFPPNNKNPLFFSLSSTFSFRIKRRHRKKGEITIITVFFIYFYLFVFSFVKTRLNIIGATHGKRLGAAGGWELSRCDVLVGPTPIISTAVL